MALVRACKAGEVIFREGDREMRMYEVKSGKVGIYSAYGTEMEKELTVIEKNGTFGEMSLLELKDRSATAVALEDSKLRVIDRDTFEEYYTEEPEKIMKVLATMTDRIRALSEEYAKACDTVAEYAAKLDEEDPFDAEDMSAIARFNKILEESNMYMMNYPEMLSVYGFSMDYTNFII